MSGKTGLLSTGESLCDLQTKVKNSVHVCAEEGKVVSRRTPLSSNIVKVHNKRIHCLIKSYDHILV